MLLVTTTVDCCWKYSRVLDLGGGSTQTDIRRETDGTQQEHWHCLLFAFFSYVGMDTIQNAKPVMHATGGKGLYQWMGHAFVCLLGSLTSTQRPLSLNKTLSDCCCDDQTQLMCSPAKLLSICTASLQVGGINTFSHSCFSKKHAELWQCNIYAKNIKAHSCACRFQSSQCFGDPQWDTRWLCWVAEMKHPLWSQAWVLQVNGYARLTSTTASHSFHQRVNSTVCK